MRGEKEKAAAIPIRFDIEAKEVAKARSESGNQIMESFIWE